MKKSILRLFLCDLSLGFILGFDSVIFYIILGVFLFLLFGSIIKFILNKRKE